MLNQILDLLTTQDFNNIQIVWQILSTDLELKKQFNDWLIKIIHKYSAVKNRIPNNESDFVTFFMAVNIKFYRNNPTWTNSLSIYMTKPVLNYCTKIEPTF